MNGQLAMHDGQWMPMHPSCLELMVLDARHVDVGHTAVFEFVEGVVEISTQGLLHPVRRMETSSRAFGGN